MRAVLQKVSRASVRVKDELVGSIERGYVILLGVLKGDTEVDVQTLVKKILGLRLFDGADGKINDRSIVDIGGSVLVVSQFTLAADLRKGNRPDYTDAAPPDEAKRLYASFLEALRSPLIHVQEGRFGAHMDVELVNDGPVTIVLDTHSRDS